MNPEEIMILINRNREPRKREPRERKTGDYAICVRIETDLVDYFKSNVWITKKSKNNYVNDLIRADFLKTIKAKEKTPEERQQELWQKYKKQHNL